jgi:predicted nucleic acid-binding protein
MTLIDTNVFIDFQDLTSPFHKWARSTLEATTLGGGSAVNLITIAELVSGGNELNDIYNDLRDLGAAVEEIPKEAAEICGLAYAKYRVARKQSGGGLAPATPLPDFFIGAHAEALGWSLATRDSQRFKAYFPNVTLVEP